jgi:hypothetical protein
MRRPALAPLVLLAAVPLLAAGCSSGNPSEDAVVIVTEPAAGEDGAAAPAPAAEPVPAPDAAAEPAAS